MNNVFESSRFTKDNILNEGGVLYINPDGKRWYIAAFMVESYYTCKNVLTIRHTLWSDNSTIEFGKNYMVEDDDFEKTVHFVQYATYLKQKELFASKEIMERLAELNKPYGIVSEVRLNADGREYSKNISIGQNYDYLKKSLRNQDINLINGVLFYDIGSNKMTIAVGVDDYSITYGDDIVYWGKDGYKFRAAIYGNTVAYKKAAEWEWENFEIGGLQDESLKVRNAREILDVARQYQLYLLQPMCNLFNKPDCIADYYNVKVLCDTLLINPTGNKWYAVLEDAFNFFVTTNGYVIHCNNGDKYKLLFNSKNDKPTIDVFIQRSYDGDYNHIDVLDVDTLYSRSQSISRRYPKTKFALHYLNKVLPGERKWVCMKKAPKLLDKYDDFNTWLTSCRFLAPHNTLGKKPIKVEIESEDSLEKWARDLQFLALNTMAGTKEKEYTTDKLKGKTLNTARNIMGFEDVDARVINPKHYNLRDTNMTAIDVIHGALTEEEFRGFCKGNILKYTIRERNKNGDEDIKKVGKYVEYLEREERGWNENGK